MDKKTLTIVALIGIGLYMWSQKRKTAIVTDVTPRLISMEPIMWPGGSPPGPGNPETMQPTSEVQGGPGFVNVSGVMQPQ